MRLRVPLIRPLVLVVFLGTMGIAQEGRDIVFHAIDNTSGLTWMGIFLLPYSGGPPLALWRPPAGRYFQAHAMCILPGNRQYCFVGGGWPGQPSSPGLNIYTWDRDTLQMTLAYSFPAPWTYPTRVYAVAADHEGDLIMASREGLWRIRASDGSYAATRVDGGRYPESQFDLVIDIDTGDYISISSAGALRFTPEGQRSVIRNDVTMLGAQDPLFGEFPVVLDYNQPIGFPLYRMSGSGALTSLGNPWVDVWAVDQEPAPSGAYIANYFDFFRQKWDIWRRSRYAPASRTLFVTPQECYIETLGIDRSLNVSTRNAGARNRWDVLVDFPNDGLSNYVCFVGMSGTRPGVPLPDGKVLLLNPDILTLSILSGAYPQFFQGLAGALDSQGSARGRIDLSSLGPQARGRTFWLVAVAVDPTGGWIRSYSNPWVVRIA